VIAKHRKAHTKLLLHITIENIHTMYGINSYSYHKATATHAFSGIASMQNIIKYGHKQELSEIVFMQQLFMHIYCQ